MQMEPAREAGRRAALEAAALAPADPLERVAWLKGFTGGDVDVLAGAVAAARSAGATWGEIGEALDENPRTVATKYGGGRDRMKRYRERKKADG